MSTKFTPTIASLTRDLQNADRAASDRLAHCQRLTQENAELLAALNTLYESFSVTAYENGGTVKGNMAKHDVIMYNQDVKNALKAARAIIARYQE